MSDSQRVANPSCHGVIVWCLGRDSNPHCMDFKSTASAIGLPRLFSFGSGGRTRTSTLFSTWLTAKHGYHFVTPEPIIFSLVAGVGIEPTFQGHEPCLEPLQLSRIFILYKINIKMSIVIFVF